MRGTPKIIELPKILDHRGNLTYIEGNKHIPFEIKRTYWIYDVPGGENRGGHAFLKQEEFIVALSGSFDVVVDDGKKKTVYQLNRSYYGLYIPKAIWRHIDNFSTNSLALVLASTFFDEGDYIRNYEEYITFLKFTNHIYPEIKFSNELVEIRNSCFAITSVEDCKLLTLDKNHKEKGNITVIENREIVPFDIKRVYYLYDVPGGEERGGHAHKELYQLIIAVSGSFDVVLDDGNLKKTVTLNRPYQGLYVIPGIWRELVNFSSGSNCLVLASHIYDEFDYIRNYSEFQECKK